MKDEPKIIKMLRVEEKLGKLKGKIQSTYESLETLEESPEDVENKNSIVEDEAPKGQKIEDTVHYEMKSDDLYRNLVEMASDAIVIVDLKGVIISCNIAALKMIGYSKEEYIGKRFSELGVFCKQGIPKFPKIFATIIRGKASPPIEFIFHRKDGATGWAEGRASLLKKNRKIVGVQVIIRDITDRKRDAEKLKESEEKFRDLFENANDLIQSVDLNGNFVYVNKKWLETLGYSKNEIGQLKLIDILRKDQIPHCMELFKKVCNGESLKNIETVFLSKNGEEIYVEGNVSSWLKDGKFNATRGIFRDITERKKAEEKIKRARDDYLNITNLTGDIIVKVDTEARWTFLNDGACQFWGKSREELLGIKFADYLHPDDTEKTNAAVQELIKTRQTVKGLINRQKTPRGWRTVEWNCAPIFDEEGRYTGLQATGRDITERKKIEENLKKSEEKFRNFVETSSDLVFSLSKTGHIEYVSSKVKEMYGYHPNELTGKHLKITTPVEGLPNALKGLKTILDDKPLKNFEINQKDKAGRIFSMEINAAPVKKDGEIVGLQGVMRDITERKKVEEKLKKAHEKLSMFNKELEGKVKERTAEVENLLEQKDEFIGQLSHDLRSPLTPLTALLPMIEEKEQDPYLKEEIGVVLQNVKYLNKLVNKTIKLAQLNSPKTTFSIVTTTLLDELNTIIEKNKLVFEENSLEIMNRVDEGIMIKADKYMLGELLYNLFTNAVKYSPRGGTITIDAKDDGNWVTVSIKDAGIGLAKEEIDHIFEEFYKADWSRHDHESSGLGLPICKGIVKKHGGHIWAKSPGKRKGTTVFFTIPSSSKEGELNINNI